MPSGQQALNPLAISETQLSQMVAARRQIESLLGDAPRSADVIDAFNLPAEIATQVRKRVVAAPEAQSRAVALLTALDWLTVTDPCQALGVAFGLQSFWAGGGDECEERSRESSLLFPNSALILQSVAFSLIGVGAFEELDALAKELVPELRRFCMPLTAETFLVASAEAALRLGRVNDARAMLPTREAIQSAAFQQSTRGAAVAEGATLVRRDNLAIELGFVESAAVAEIRPFSERWATILAETIEAVRSLLERTGKHQDEIETAVARLEALRDVPGGTGVSEMSRVVEMLATVEDILLPLAPGLVSRADRLRTTTEGLESNDPQASNAALEELSRLQNEELAARDADGWLSYAWVKSLILERQGKLEAALEVLADISATRDVLAEGAESAQGRAGLSSSFKDLPSRTAALRLRTGSGIEAAFEDIESGKARWLADTIRSDAPRLAVFRERTAAERIHYLTFAVGSDVSVAVFVPASGDPTAAEIPIGRDEIARAAEDMTYRRQFRAGLVANLADRLGRLTAWLPAPTVDGAIRPGDVLIMAPHGPLHSIPLHALPARDGLPLAPRLAVVRTHGAALIMRTAATKVSLPSSSVLLCSLVTDEPQRARRAESFARLVCELASFLPCRVLDGIEADFANLHAQLRPSQAVHLFAHGDATSNAPYTRSGLLLPSGGQLSKRGWKSFLTDHLLSPERIAKTDWKNCLEGTHITLQACVSSHAQANLRGDAIGLEWSLLLSGAASVLATHWHIDFATSTDFCTNFYGFWLGSGFTRAEAWRRTADQLIGAGGAEAWAAFSLTGDWR
jgi:hypothetical protein